MHRSRLILQNAASKATASAKVAAIPAVPKISFDDKSSAQILSSRNPPLYKPLYHHLDPSLLKYREPGSFSYLLHHIKSSYSLFYSICTSQQTRDKFLHLTSRVLDTDDDGDENNNTGIINTYVLNQSDLGFMKMMTLFQDLSNPLFDEIKFDKETHVRQFLDGCSFALEQFHTVQADYLKKLEATLDNSSENEVEEATSTTKEKPFQYKFFDIAENDPESTESRLMNMLSPEGLDRIFFDTAMYSFVKNVNSQLVKSGDSAAAAAENDSHFAGLMSEVKVVHTCLLSARVEEIEAGSENEGRRKSEDNDPDAPLEDESLQPFAETRDDRKSQIILQLEVLYDLEFLSQTEDADNNKSFKSVSVAKFETCLRDDPNGEEMQWRLCSWRPAKEFGHM